MRKTFCLISFVVYVSNLAMAQEINLCPDNNHPHMIDLGLDDGTLWSCCNVGANTPEEYGDYFAWGETTPKDYYYWDTYKWCNGSSNTLKKYNYDANCGTVDYKYELDIEDDAAHVNWGSDWHMPSIDQVDCLYSGTTRVEATVNGIKGFYLKGKNGNTIFMPDAGGMQYECTFENTRSYWTRTLDFYEINYSAPYNAIKFNWTDDGACMYCFYPRWRGYPIRPVISVPRPSSVILNEMNFPDANFRKALAEKYNISDDGNDEIIPEKIVATGILKLSQKNISDLTGIEYFTELTRLYCDNNHLTSLDLSKNTKLTVLDISNNQLTSLNVSNNIYLKNLDCSNNLLTSFDVSKNPRLNSLDCSDNQIAVLDISRNTDLDYLYCSNNLLSSLKVYSCWHLRILHCFGNSLTSLTGLSANFLVNLNCYSNQIKGPAMDALVNSLWKNQLGAQIIIIDTKDQNEGNVCTETHVAIAKSKGWTVCDYNGGDIQEYEGNNMSSIELIENDNTGKDTYYTLDGKMLNGKPKQQGAYIKDRHKVVVK